MRWFPFNIFRSEERVVSAEFENAVNKALTADTVADATRKPYISEEGALNLSAVWACVRILSETVGTLPIHLYKRTDKGRERQYAHACHKLLQLPNSFSNRFDLMHHLMISCALWGNGYARIHRGKDTRPIRLQLIHPAKVEPILNSNEELFYRLDNGELLPNDELIHLRGLSTNGIKGKSPIAVHRDNLSLTMAAQEYGERFFNQGGNMSGVFKYPSTLKPEAYQRLKKDLVAQSVGLHNAHIPLLLEGGMTYERISIPPEDAQFIATRKFQKTEIATIYGIPPHMIADLERATNNNIEHQGMEFVTYCLMPYLVRLEEEFNRKLLRYDEFEEYYFLFGLNGLLRGDAKTRSEYYKNMNFVGAMNANEIRSLEDMNAYEGGDEYFVQMNMQTVKNAINGEPKNSTTGNRD
ncbi:phage portal protein [Parabacteroides provencensis]|uniref:phage portal protein n=1 Tax=Parabacteroides provencensis TaxID=1944636 RepID=UPI000C1559D5|nr:phage portal protein [Parabacteroides provencensis]